MRVLQIRSKRLGPVEEVTEYLANLQQAYNHLFALELIISDAKQRYGEQYFGRRYVSGTPVRSLKRIGKPERFLLPEDRLHLRRIVIGSPGFWEFMGTLSPLETIRKYLSDRHERKKDKDYRGELEAERMRLENERLRTETTRDRIELLRSIGIPENRIREVVNVHLIGPLGLLDRAQDSDLIQDAEIVDVADRNGVSGEM